MWRMVGLAAILGALAGCVSTKTSAVDDTSRLLGKTVALTSRPRAAFMAATPGKAMFAVLGAVAMEEAGRKIVSENNIEDPAVRVGRDLLSVAQRRYGVVSASISPVSIDSTDIKQLAHAAAGADFLLDVQSYGQGLNFRSDSLTHYWVNTLINVRVIDVVNASLIAEGHCFADTRKDPDPPTYDQLLADHASRLKAILDAQSDECTSKFKREVLKIE